jgi:ABC-type phosphate/phosphonate transport system permease subunit
MEIDKQINEKKIFRKATKDQRLKASIILLVILGFFGIAGLTAKGMVNPGKLFGPFGFKQKYRLPCPTCGMTSSAVAFAKGQIGQSFYIQPAGGLLYSLLVITAFLAFLISVFGIYLCILERIFVEVKIKHVILGLAVIVAAGWIVTLTRALAVKN